MGHSATKESIHAPDQDSESEECEELKAEAQMSPAIGERCMELLPYGSKMSLREANCKCCPAASAPIIRADEPQMEGAGAADVQPEAPIGTLTDMTHASLLRGQPG